jgi:hypothetical protein
MSVSHRSSASVTKAIDFAMSAAVGLSAAAWKFDFQSDANVSKKTTEAYSEDAAI